MCDTSQGIHKVSARRLRSFVAKGEVSESEALKEWRRRDIERYKEYRSSKLRNTWAADKNLSFETCEARLARMELARRVEWEYDERGEAACSVATALACAAAVALNRVVAAEAAQESADPPTVIRKTTTRRKVRRGGYGARRSRRGGSQSAP